MPNSRWRRGVSATSIGRFGGMRDDLVPYDSGYLVASATATDVYVNLDYDDNVDIGHFLVPPDHRVETKTDWTGNRYTFSCADGRPHSVVTRSLLFPGFHHRIATGVFEYYWRIKNYGPTELHLPLKGGVKCIDATAGYDRRRDGELTKPWVFFTFSGTGMPFDYPVVFTFDRHPEKIEIWTHEYLKIHFRTKRASVVQVFPFGAERLDKQRTAEWKSGLPGDVVKKLDFWSAASLAYPEGCREDFRVDEKKSVVRLRNHYRYLESKSAWEVKPVHLAPLPPVLSSARHEEYPVKVKGRLLKDICPTFLGPYEAVKGKTIEYTLPLSRFRDVTLSPIMVKNDEQCADVTGRLAAVLEGGDYMTFGGDDHYEVDCSLDALHDLRIMSWATWSIPEQRRPEVFRLLTRGLKDFGEDDFLEFETPVTNTKWVRHKTIFDYRGIMDYDMEWYNGMNLAGLWAYAYYGPQGEGLKFARKHWPLIRKIFDYFPAYTDWALVTSWTCCRGEGCWLDGINYSYEGLLCYAALARELGRQKDADWGDYLAAKIEAYLWNAWRGAPYQKKHFQPDVDESAVVAGFFEGRPPNVGDGKAWSCGIYSYCVRVLYVLMRDLGKEDDIAAAIWKFGKDFPDWRQNPYRYGKGTGYPGSDTRRTIHHYFLDPRLMVCALVLGEDLSSLMKVDVTLTAPVLESYLVAQAPMVLVPRRARFLGTTWDAAARRLTVLLSGKGRVPVELAHCGEPTEVSTNASLKRSSDARRTYDVSLKGETELTFQF